MLNPRSGAYGGGYGDFFGYRDLLADWRAAGDFAGLGARSTAERRELVTRRGRDRRRASGIGAAIAEELGRQGVFVVTVDPGVAVDGTPQSGGAEATTAQRIVDAGGQARASNISVTDDDAVRALFAGLVDEFGALDAVVNVAGISRPTGFASGVEDDWRAVLDVHLNGYLNVLRAALPIMAAAGHGRILGVTSGSGWRAADAGAYSCAKRAVAALTWQIGQATPDGRDRQRAVAHRRHPDGARARLQRQAGAGNRPGATRPPGACRSARCRRPSTSGRSARTSRATTSRVVPRADHVLERRRGRVGGPAAPARGGPHRRRRVAAARCSTRSVPAVFAPAEAAQASNGGGNPRVGTAFDEAAPDGGPATRAGRAASSSPTTPRGAPRSATRSARAASSASASVRGRAAHGSAEPATGFDAAAEQLAGVARDAGPIDAVVVALVGDGCDRAGGGRPGLAAGPRRARRDHRPDPHRRGVGAGGGRSRGGDRPARPGRHRRRRHDRRRAEPGPGGGAARPRRAHGATSDRVDAFAISVEAAPASARAGRRRGRRLPGVQRRRRRAVRRGARRRRRVVRPAQPSAARPGRSRSAARPSPTGSTARSATMVTGRLARR